MILKIKELELENAELRQKISYNSSSIVHPHGMAYGEEVCRVRDIIRTLQIRLGMKPCVPELD